MALMYKIKLPDGRFSGGGIRPEDNSRHGKLWLSCKDLRQHFNILRLYYRKHNNPIAQRYPDGFKIVIYELSKLCESDTYYDDSVIKK